MASEKKAQYYEPKGKTNNLLYALIAVVVILAVIAVAWNYSRSQQPQVPTPVKIDKYVNLTVDNSEVITLYHRDYIIWQLLSTYNQTVIGAYENGRPTPSIDPSAIFYDNYTITGLNKGITIVEFSRIVSGTVEYYRVQVRVS